MGAGFAAAISVVRRFGGVLEHPEASHAFAHYGLPKPPKYGGWIDAPGGHVCCVEQGHYGHKARKATWLYVVGVAPPDFIWGPSRGQRLDEGFHSREERNAARGAGQKPRPRLIAADNRRTPPAFAEWLVSLARASTPPDPADSTQPGASRP